MLIFVLLLLSGLTLVAFRTDVCRAQSSDMPFAAEPAPESPSFKTGYFVINASPGSSVTEILRLTNESSAPIRLSIKTVDATTGPYGGVSYGLPSDPVVNVGTWVSLPANAVDLAPREVKTIPVNIKVPSNATIGDHIAGLAIWQPRPANQSGPKAAGLSAGVDTQVRRVLSVQVVVPGPAAPLLVIKGVRPVVRPDGVYLETDIASEDNLLTRGEGFLELPENNYFRRDITLDTFVPGTAIAYPVKWINNLEDGTYRAHVLIHYDNNRRIAEWSGSFTVGPNLTAQEKAREGGESHTLLYAISLVAILVMAGLFLIFLWRRRKREERDKETQTA